MAEMSPDQRQALAQLIDAAERSGQWLHCGYQDLWFSPAELRKYNAEGRFIWGVVNWTLRDPQELLTEAHMRVSSAQGEYDRLVARVQASAQPA